MRFLPRVLLVTCALAAAIGWAAARGGGTVFAHRLGNFTINHYDRISPSDRGIEVYSVLDMAEIPAFRERQQIDANGDGTIDPQESEAYATAKAAVMQSQLVLRVAGRAVPLIPVAHVLSFPPGQGGLSLLRLTVTYTAPLPGDWRATPSVIEFEDHNESDRLGWREIIVRAGGGVRILGSSVPSQDATAELTAYPSDALSSPLDQRSATATFEAAAGAAPDSAASPRLTAVRGNPDAPLARFASLIARGHLSAGVIVLALLAAVGFGAIHALSPGHGKTIVAAYLVGSKGTGRHALLLGLTVTLTHTSSVYLLGFVSLYLSQYIVPERLYPWLTVASGTLIVAMGVALLAARLRSAGVIGAGAKLVRAALVPIRPPLVAEAEVGALRLATAPSVAHAGHGEGVAEHEHARHERHGAAHRHGFGPAHTHALPGADGEPVTWRRLLGLGIFGGLLPCPSAIVVMLSAISLHRVGFGLVLIVAFSAGLAGVLTSIGFALVYGRRLFDRMPQLRRISAGSGTANLIAAGAVRAFPLVSAAAVVSAGFVLMLPALAKV
jgi:ABC-type nickel/cobalt efflux system permease component RcnA